MPSRKFGPPTRHPHESSTTPCTESRHDSETTPHDPLCASLSGRSTVVTHSRSRPPPQFLRLRYSGVPVEDFHRGSIKIFPCGTRNSKKREGQTYQSTYKRPSRQQHILSVCDAPSVPAAEPAPSPPASRGHPPSLSVLHPTQPIILRMSSAILSMVPILISHAPVIMVFPTLLNKPLVLESRVCATI